MKIKVTQMSVDDSNFTEAKVNIFGRTENGNRAHFMLTGFKPYFYLDEEPRPNSAILQIAKSGLSLTNDELFKVTVRVPNDVPDIRKHYPIHYEADIPFVSRVRYDLGIKSVVDIESNTPNITSAQVTPAEADIMPRYWNFDIETSDEDGFADPKYPTAPVLSFSIFDNYTKTIYAAISKNVDKAKVKKMLSSAKWLKKHCRTDNEVQPNEYKIKIWCVEDEYRLFLQFIKIYNTLRPDFLMGWNAINYDIPYMKERSGTRSERIVNKIKSRYPCPDFSEIGEFDLMEKYKALYKAKKGELESKSLQFCSEQELGYGKLKHDEGFFALYSSNPEKFLAYNIWDTIVAERLNEKKGIFFYYRTLSEEAGTFIKDTDYFSLLIDSLILHRLNGIVVLPSKTNLYAKKDVVGAYTHRPIKGKRTWVVMIDFKQQYPGGIRSLNMSPETVLPDDYKGECFIAPSGTKYKKSPRGLLPMILDELSQTRDALKAKMQEYEYGSPEYKSLDAQQTSYKFFMNSFYGVMATKKGIFRLTDNMIGFDIPDLARHLTKYTIKLLEKNNIEVVYGDTDSCLLKFPGIEDPKEVISKAKKLVKWLNKKYTDFYKKLGASDSDNHFFSIEAEQMYEVYFQSAHVKNNELVGKKRYAGLVAWQDGKWLLDKPFSERLVIKGYEVRRSDASFLTRELQKKVLTMILTNEPPQAIRDIIRNAIQSIKENPGPDIGIPKGINKEYDGDQIQMRAAQFSNENLGYNFGVGDKPFYFYGYIDGLPTTDVFAIDWGDKLPEGAVINIDMMLKRVIENPLTPIIEGIGYSWSELIEGKSISRQGTLF